VLKLGVHAVQGAAAPGRGARGGQAGTRRRSRRDGVRRRRGDVRQSGCVHGALDDKYRAQWIEGTGATLLRGHADEILVATGRRPNTADVGLDTVGLEPGRPIGTDDQLRAVGVDGGWLYAVGDVNGRALLTHHGKYQARLVGDHLAGHHVEARADHDALVRVVFTDPQVAAVGLTAAGARDRGRGRDVDVLSYDIGAVAGGALQGTGVTGTAQLVVDGAARHHRRRDVHRTGRRRDAPRRHDRDHLGRHRRPAVARHPGVPHPQRGVAAPARNRPGNRMSIDAPRVGDRAPRLVLPDLDGTVTALRDLRGRPVLVSFLRHAG
jgi:hypothetical protein